MSDHVLIRGAKIIDGTGAPWFLSDLRIKGTRIADIGPNLAADGAAEVEADGRYLAPGFIDAHCHDDLICLREPGRPEKTMQGVTTVVVGNCSFSLYPKTPRSADVLRQHFSSLLGATDPGEVFDNFADYRAILEARGIALNIVSLVGHAALRLAVLGYERRPATPEDRARMQDLLARQLREGAAGLSLGLVYPPSAYADAAELRALAETVGAHGKIVAAHIRSYEQGLCASIEEFIDILKSARAPGLLSHLQLAGRPNWGAMPAALATLEAARADGVDISFDMYPYLAGSSYILQLLPPAALEGGLPALLARLDDPATREGLRKAVEEGNPDPHAPKSKVAMIGWGNVHISGTGNPALKALEGKDMQAAADAVGTTPFDLMVRLIREDEGQTTIVLFQLDAADLRAAFTHPLHMVGSDGLPRPGTKPHPRAYGTFPRVAGRLRREHWFSLEDAVRRMTSVAAQRFGLADRGVLRPGMAADMVLFDDAIDDKATFDTPVQLPTGMHHVWVAGEAVVEAAARPAGFPGGSWATKNGGMMRKALIVDGAAKLAGPYSHAVIANGFIYVSGQGPADPKTNVAPDSFAEQVRQTLRNVQTILKGAGADFEDVVKVNAYLSDLTRFQEYNAIYKEFFTGEPPARTTIGCQLYGIQVEIDCVAVQPD